MQKWLLPFVVLALLATGGCAGRKSGGTTQRDSSGEKQQSEVSFVRRQMDQVPDKVRETVQKNLDRESSGVIEAGGHVWVFLTRGQKRTGGYQVNITDVRLHSGEPSKLTVSYSYTDPAPGSFRTQVLTYPVELVMLKDIAHFSGKVEFKMLR